MDQDIPLGTEVGLGPGDCVRWGPSSASEKKGTTPQFLAHVYCGQTARWMKTPLGTEIDLGSGHIVLDGDPAPPRERGTAAPPPLFGPCLLWPSPTSATAELWYCHSRLGSENKNAAEFCIGPYAYVSDELNGLSGDAADGKA